MQKYAFYCIENIIVNFFLMYPYNFLQVYVIYATNSEKMSRFKIVPKNYDSMPKHGNSLDGCLPAKLFSEHEIQDIFIKRNVKLIALKINMSVFKNLIELYSILKKR